MATSTPWRSKYYCLLGISIEIEQPQHFKFENSKFVRSMFWPVVRDKLALERCVECRSIVYSYIDRERERKR